MNRSRILPQPVQVITRSVGERLRAARVAAGLTGREVLERVGIDPGNLSRMERSKRTPTVEVLGRLAALYGVSLAEILGPEPEGGPSWLPRLSPNLSVDAFLACEESQEGEELRRRWGASPDLRRMARVFAIEVFEPVRAVLGVNVVVRRGLRFGPSPGGAPASLPCSRSHADGLGADVVPVGMCLPVAMTLLATAVRSGAVPSLDLATIEGDSVLHLQAAPEGRSARQEVEAPTGLDRWSLQAVASRSLIP